MEKILGLDLGTNSLGWALRNTMLVDNQFEKYGVLTFDKGVGEVKGIEFSRAAERTKNRSLRRRYQAHKYKLWATLEILIENDYCPLSLDGLNLWRKYEKGKGRVYPLTEVHFNNWIKLDFDGDGKPDYTSPYQLRLELATEKVDTTNKEGRYKIGRALYHIAQHRAFKSSKKVQDKDENTNEEDYVGAEKKRAKFIEDLQAKHNVTTVGSAFAMEEKLGIRIRKNLHQHVIRKQLQLEVKSIFDFQGLSFSELFKKDINKSAIFWQRPLRSQKGSVGKCTLEPTKFRCPTSHPSFEAFRAWSFLNTIEYRLKDEKESRWQKIPFEVREKIYQEKYFRISVADFDFTEIRKLIEKINGNVKWELNYKDKTNVSASPISARLKDIFGEGWLELKINRTPNQNSKEKKTVYTIEDIWHVLFSFDDEDEVRNFAIEKLKLDNKAEKFVALWYKMPVAYSMLSLNAINKIVPFLQQGFIYTEAVLLAKMPDVLGKEIWDENKQNLTESIGVFIQQNRDEKKILTIANGLIAAYKSLDNTLKFAERDYAYSLKEDDKQDVLKACINTYGIKTWDELNDDEKLAVVNKVGSEYQSFFLDSTRSFKKLPHLLETLKNILKDNFDLDEKQLNKLYHPSQIQIYPHAKQKYYEQYKANLTLLESPKTSAFKNPMAMRTLYELRKLINYLIITEQIDEETKVTVEIARDLNDANMRWAIETYQRQRQEENKEFANAIVELLKEFPSGKADPNSNEDIDKFRLWFEQMDDEIINDGKGEYSKHEWTNTKSKVYKQVAAAKEMIEKYRLWKEQQCQCIYTGRMISITDLFSENNTDFEHTIPRSISFDNSLANLTICDFDYNRNIKKNKFPAELPNYTDAVTINGKTYSAIKPRLQKWIEKVESIKINIDYWVKKSKQAADKDAKDKAIKQRHLWRFELEYWQNKVNRFTMTEVKSGFKNSQLTDTQIISKYAYHYLKTVFNKVKVQKGSITAEFRRVYGIQQKDEKKDRSKHSHHAKDAAILTLIPIDAKREDILKKSYEQFEKYRHQYTESPYYGFKPSHIEEIESNILINTISKDQALTPSSKRVRVRGRKVYLKDEQGNPKEKWSKGDSVRGQLHLDSFYGKIKVVERDKNNYPQKDEEGNWKYIEKNDGFKFVKRELVDKDLKIENIVDPHVKAIFIKQMNGRNLDKTLKEDQSIWMLKKNGEKAHAIRHVRCFANDVTDPLAIKKQSHLSSKDYKKDYWAKNEENYAYGYYTDGGKNRAFKMLNLLDASKIHSMNSATDSGKLFEDFILKGATKLNLTVIKAKQKVLFYSYNKNEIFDLKGDQKELGKRLYVIKRLFSKTSGQIQFQHHLEARSDEQLSNAFPKETYGVRGKNGFSKFELEKQYPRLLLSPISFNFLLEGKDFETKPDGTIRLFYK
ncbi:type II CRISPR RNA-guided endonuclease Cas9 [Parasediminibacterium paludis]|uniref:Type II CRISPR RNA-guided endonuclease Cas9 n=1 Tax=Parasediminibacterium paludis TaxID=908966 RepID=A0ABV8Q094_9BACT